MTYNESQKQALGLGQAQAWPVFRSRLLDDVYLARQGSRAVLYRGGPNRIGKKRLVSMDTDEVRDLIDTLQKFLSVME